MSSSGSDGNRARTVYSRLSLLGAAVGVYLLFVPWILPAIEAAIPGHRQLSCAGRADAVRCSLCGLTRGFRAMWHGDVDSARHFHPRAPVLFAAVAVETALRLCVVLALRTPRIRTAPLLRLDAGLHAGAGIAVALAPCIRPA
jgi:hypothetical protein